MSSSSRNKGHGFERALVKLFRCLGFINCQTSRYASKFLDDQKVDLCETGKFYVQAKAVERLSPSYHEILASMPYSKNKINLIFHKRSRKGTTVTMTQEHFLELVSMIDFEKLNC